MENLNVPHVECMKLFHFSLLIFILLKAYFYLSMIGPIVRERKCLGDSEVRSIMNDIKYNIFIISILSVHLWLPSLVNCSFLFRAF